MNHIADKQISIPVSDLFFWLAIAGFTLLVSLLAEYLPSRFIYQVFNPTKY